MTAISCEREISATCASNRFTIVDLFCGAGGLSLGLRMAGLTPIYAVDHFPPAVQTYIDNIAPHAKCEDVSDASNFPKATVYVGGPPCQGFSSAGLRLNGDARNNLVKIFATLVARHLPDAFVFENVEGFLTTEGGERVVDLLSPLIEAGYHIHLRKINAANYGVPQHRKRVVAIGGLGWDPSFPEPTCFAYGAPGASLVGHELPHAPTLLDCIGDLPCPAQDERDALVADHFSRVLSKIELERATLLKPGQRMRDLPVALWHPSYARRASRRVMDGTPLERRGGAPSGMRRLLPDQPSKAITAAARNEFVHPYDNRTLTLRECARLQAFPDDFNFVGSASDRALLIGNAVPPLLAFRIGLALAEGLSATKSRESDGQLLSFIPTVSNGMSPALMNTTMMIKRLFGLAPAGRQRLLWD